MKTRYFKCAICGKIVAVVKDTPSQISCCNQLMNELEAKETDDLLKEKHVPVFTRKEDKVVVTIGKNIHPHSKDHYIEWVALRTNHIKLIL